MAIRLLGQKRGMALNAATPIIVNSYVSGVQGRRTRLAGDRRLEWARAVTRIENNYLEGAGENVVLRRHPDPTIPTSCPTDIMFRRNLLASRSSWRIRSPSRPPTGALAETAAGGALAAGTYSYRVAARLDVEPERKSDVGGIGRSVGDDRPPGRPGSVRVSWAPLAGAQEYLVYGRKAGGQTMYLKTSATFFVDGGAAGTAVGSPSATEKPGFAGTKWAVKNNFELKSAQDVLIEGNVFETLWIADQTGYPIVFTPRNQGGRAPWTVVQRVVFRNKLFVRHTAGGIPAPRHRQPQPEFADPTRSP